MARAYAMEHEAMERYTRFAEQLEASGNGECALLFRQLAEIEDRHARRILLSMGWTSLPVPLVDITSENHDAPETARLDAVRYLTQPHQALELALRCENQAQRYFERLASGDVPRRVRVAATEMAAEERSHAKLLEHWLAQVPRPISGWD
jgi:rubrerythrin